MIHDSTPYRVIKISELTRLIASQLVLIDARKSAVNLACGCQSLEESILSTLWETQWPLLTLLEVLPEQTWERGPSKGAVRGLNPPLEGLKFEPQAILACGRGGSITRGLEQSQPLCVLDVPSPHG